MDVFITQIWKCSHPYCFFEPCCPLLLPLEPYYLLYSKNHLFAFLCQKAIHFFLHCPSFHISRQTLLNNIRNINGQILSHVKDQLIQTLCIYIYNLQRVIGSKDFATTKSRSRTKVIEMTQPFQAIYGALERNKTFFQR